MKKIMLVLITVNIFYLGYAQSWSLTGNSATNPGTNFLGTTDNKSLLFRMNNTYSGEIDSINAKTFFGFAAGKNSTGSYNTAVGFKALTINATGYFNTAYGANALFSNSTGHDNVATGMSALNSSTTASYNTANGSYALKTTTTGSNNSAMGYGSLFSNSIGEYNTATGAYSLFSNTTGSFNVATGYHALYSNISGYWNTAVGERALEKITTGYGNTALGLHTAQNIVAGTFNVGIGEGCMLNANGASFTCNTAIGSVTLESTVNSSNNVALGYHSCYYYNVGNNNCFLGTLTDANAAGYSNSTTVGYAATSTASNQVRFGNSTTSSIGGYTAWSNISDGRYKKDVKENVIGLEFIMKLRPVTYLLDGGGISKKLNEDRGKDSDKQLLKAISEKEKIVYTGFIAQEVEQAAKKVGYDFSGVDKPKNETDLYGLRYAEFVVPLVKGMQQQQEQISN